MKTENRLFRVGDRVRLVAWRGRTPFELDFDEFLEVGLTGYVREAEKPKDCCLGISLDKDHGSDFYAVPIQFLELVQPAENMPYWLEDKHDGRITIYKSLPDGNARIAAVFWWVPISEDGLHYQEAQHEAFSTLFSLNNVRLEAEETPETIDHPSTPEHN